MYLLLPIAVLVQKGGGLQVADATAPAAASLPPRAELLPLSQRNH